MDFDEYDYLEKTVENPELPKEEPRAANGVRPEDRDQGKGSREGRPDDAERSFRHARSEDDRRRDSSRHWRDGERGEKERHRSGRERREREGSQKDREREKERDRERDRERIRERDREMEAERERERERARPVRGPRPERHHEERDRFGGRSKDVEFREREPKEKQSNGRRYKEKKEDGTEPEADPERDQRTVFAYQITLKADERDVYEFFSRAGKVRDVRLIMDRNSRRSKGVGYIEFYDVMSVPMAIALSGQKLLGQAVMVKPSEAEKNLVQSNTAAASGPGGLIGPYSGGVRRLYVGNLHLSITEEQLRQVFEPFGLVELVQLPREPGSQQCKGYGFVQFARLEDARAAQNLNGQLEIAGRTIKVSAVADQVGMQDIGTNAGDFDDDEGGGLGLDARSRALLMQKLDRSGITTSVASAPVANSPVLSTPAASVLGAPPVVAAPAQPSVPGLLGLPGSSLPVAAAAVPQVDSIGVPSECLLLKNMFDPSLETEPDFDFDIKEDVQDECSKFGTLKHIFVDKNSTGFVYLRFDNATSAISAQRALHGRWFAGKMITATFMLPQNYIAKFPESA